MHAPDFKSLGKSSMKMFLNKFCMGCKICALCKFYIKVFQMYMYFCCVLQVLLSIYLANGLFLYMNRYMWYFGRPFTNTDTAFKVASDKSFCKFSAVESWIILSLKCTKRYISRSGIESYCHNFQASLKIFFLLLWAIVITVSICHTYTARHSR